MAIFYPKIESYDDRKMYIPHKLKELVTKRSWKAFKISRVSDFEAQKIKEFARNEWLWCSHKYNNMTIYKDVKTLYVGSVYHWGDYCFKFLSNISDRNKELIIPKNNLHTDLKQRLQEITRGKNWMLVDEFDHYILSSNISDADIMKLRLAIKY